MPARIPAEEAARAARELSGVHPEYYEDSDEPDAGQHRNRSLGHPDRGRQTVPDIEQLVSAACSSQCAASPPARTPRLGPPNQRCLVQERLSTPRR
jgi:hypothetical protein